MTFDELKLLPGSALQLVLDAQSEQREASKLIGYVTGRTLLVVPPVLTPEAPGLPERGLVEVHGYSEAVNCAILFSVSIQRLIEQPCPILCLGYPAFIALDESRKAARVATQLEVILKGPAGDLPGRIVDLSVSGCRVESVSALGEPGVSLVLVTRLALPGGERAVQVAGTVRGVLGKPDGVSDYYSYGLSFDALNDAGKALLTRFIEAQVRPQ